MFDSVPAADIVRVICSAYLLSTCLLLSFTSCSWWVLSHIEQQDNHHPNWFS